jgi:hypothetical protein
MHPVPVRDHPGVRDTPGSSASDLINALFITVVAIVDLVASLMYGFAAHP